MAKTEETTTFTIKSERVKAVDFHPTEPWVACALFNGEAHIWNWKTKDLVHKFSVSDGLPLRAIRFIASKGWIVVGSDDMHIRFYDYKSMELVKDIITYGDYIRSIAVHPTEPYLLTAADDMIIKMWNWETGKLVREICGHTHYVMSVAFNPKNPSMFASGSLDKTVKIWNMDTSECLCTFEGHKKGVNCVGFMPWDEIPWLVSGSDDKHVRIWNYETKKCIANLKVHEANVTSICFHPTKRMFVTVGEESVINVWELQVGEAEFKLRHTTLAIISGKKLEEETRIWTIANQGDCVAIGHDRGMMIVDDLFK